ncbi:threonine kinase [Paenibacillus sp. ov031]|uniref:GHMP family kinase ATP-binding protein n=1 Tax=Paenibacillus sp. ov031 TaxID=1761879 RepID=UPI000922D45D|nr:kinase [Paenibacillus sp. ov031]SHN84634.1 threonine kinase [Paenibacillus sp. ov031]
MSSYLERKNLTKSIGVGKSFGTFGELLQGVGTDAQNFLITLPINRYSNVTFQSQPSLPHLIVSPSYRSKSRKIALRILQLYDLPLGGFIEINSNIPVGKGLASSSADIVATARAIDHCFGLNLTAEQLEALIQEIEPTDGVMYDGIVSYYHRAVRLRESLGPVPNLSIVSIDEGGEVDTTEFNKISRSFSAVEKLEYDHMLASISAAIKRNDLKAVGKISTQSAIMNQRLLEKKQMERVLDICNEVDGLGIVITHSGTCTGILLDQTDVEYCWQLHKAYELMSLLHGEVTIFHTNMEVV